MSEFRTAVAAFEAATQRTAKTCSDVADDAWVYHPRPGFSIAEIGLVFAAVYLLASFVAHRGDFLRRRFGEDALLWGMLGTLAVSFILLNRTTGPLALFLLAVQAFANGLYSPLVKPMLNREIVESSRRATVLSVESIARRSAIGIFSPIAGVYGASSALYLCGALGLVGFTVLLVFAVHVPTVRSPARSAPTTD